MRYHHRVFWEHQAPGRTDLGGGEHGVEIFLLLSLKKLRPGAQQNDLGLRQVGTNPLHEIGQVGEGDLGSIQALNSFATVEVASSVIPDQEGQCSFEVGP